MTSTSEKQAGRSRTDDARGAIKPMVPGLTGELIAEFLGTFIVILFGVGVVAQVVAGEIGGHDSIAWSWGLGVTMGIYVAARISGAHLNPAVIHRACRLLGFQLEEGRALRAGADRGRLRGGPSGAVELHRGDREGRSGPHHQDPRHLLDPAGQRHLPVSDLGACATRSSGP